MSEIAKGDVVKLKSGGPKMSVVDIGDYSPTTENGAKCVWFDSKNTKFEDVFDVAVLEIFKEPEVRVFSI